MTEESALLAEIRACLEHAFRPELLHLEDESWRHAGHREAGRGAHIRLEIASLELIGLSRIEAHRKIHEALRPLFERGAIHALSIRIRNRG